jgi:hypothetical protein
MNPRDRQITERTLILRACFPLGLLAAQQSVSPDVNHATVRALHPLGASHHLLFANTGVAKNAHIVPMPLVTLNALNLLLRKRSNIER